MVRKSKRFHFLTELESNWNLSLIYYNPLVAFQIAKSRLRLVKRNASLLHSRSKILLFSFFFLTTEVFTQSNQHFQGSANSFKCPALGQTMTIKSPPHALPSPPPPPATSFTLIGPLLKLTLVKPTTQNLHSEDQRCLRYEPKD